ncbi:MAG: RagB/SusD family nutrient uptake outer membrane protein [Bacteroidota bacterium]
MNSIFRNILTLLLFGLSLGSCDSFLDEIPDNRVELNTLGKAAQLLTNGYSIASPAFTDWATDDVQYTIGTNIRPSQLQIYTWQEVENGGPNEVDTPDFFWFETYESIAHANEVLAALDDLPVVSAEDRDRRDALEGEAKLIRAYGHFMLVNMFAEHFSDASSGGDPGVPYVKDPETNFIQQYERESVRRVYGEIEDDLLDGLELISDNFFLNSGKYHFNRNAALAFASRFYLYQFEIRESLRYSNELLGNSPESFVRDMTSETFLQAKSSITGYPQLYSSPDQAANLLLMRKISLVQRPDFSFASSNGFYNSLFAQIPVPGGTDERENPAFVKGQDLTGDQGLFPVRYENLFERSSLNSNVGTPYHIGIMFRGEEVLFNRIECNIYLNNIQEAINDLNLLFRKRYSGEFEDVTLASLRTFLASIFGSSDGISDLNVLFNVLIIEKRKEFIAQGMRWFDAKRWGLDMIHDLPDGSLIALRDGDPRWAWQIPNSAIEVGGLEPNDR